jgi:hypothetical protein
MSPRTEDAAVVLALGVLLAATIACPPCGLLLAVGVWATYHSLTK